MTAVLMMGLIVALVMVFELRQRVRRLEIERDLSRETGRAAPPRETAAEAADTGGEGPTLDEWMRSRQPPTPPRPAATTTGPRDTVPPPLPPRPELAAASASTPPPRPTPLPFERAAARSARSARDDADPVTLATRAVRRWFSEGNVPVKVGMLVFFAGIAALLKYAADQGWMRLPIELRLAGIALAAVAGLVFGWRQREHRRNFALSLQGGAIGVLLLVVFAAFKFYTLIPVGAAFAVTVVLVAGAGVLAVRQNAIALAVLGILAGFLAPILLSTGRGDHVALFGYYALLNLAIFAIAWWRAWRVLNLLGFVFTFGIGTMWGVLQYRPEHFATTEPFLLLFFACYLLIPILYAQRRPQGKRDLIDGCLVFGTPLVAFALQAALLEGERMTLAFCAVSLAAVYAALGWWLLRRERFVTLTTAYALLAVGFATLAVPLALSAQATACVFALEGAALVWLGLHQQRGLPQFAGLVLQVLAAGAFMLGVVDQADTVQPLLNATFMGALLIAVAGFASAWSYGRSDSAGLALPYYLWGLAWWTGNGLNEIHRFVVSPHGADAVLAFAALSGWIAAEVHRRAPARMLAWTTVTALLAGFPLAIAQDAAHAQPFAGYGIAAWSLYALAGVRSLRCLRDDAGDELALAHGGWLLSWIAALSLLLDEVVGRAQYGDGWWFAAVVLPTLVLAALVQWRPQFAAFPLAARFDRWRALLQGLLMLVLACAAVFVLSLAGSSAPLPWMPVLNPLELAQLATVGVIAAWLVSSRAPEAFSEWRAPLLAGIGFVLVSAVTLRATHHWGDVPWDGSMFSTSVVQTSLTIVWSVLGVLGWIAGSRRGQHGLWLVGATLMGVVLVKLILVDRTHLGTMFGIASFIAYGLLCTVVGYFAPAPPRLAHEHSEATP